MLIALLSLAGSAGCAAQPRCGPATSAPTPADWPARITEGLDELAARTPSDPTVGQSRASPVGKVGKEHVGGVRAQQIVCAEARGLGVVLELKPGDAHAGYSTSNESELIFVSFSPLTSAKIGEQAAELPRQITLDHIQAGVRWRLYEPNNGSVRGLIVHLGGNKYVRRAFLKRNWAVLSSTGTGRYLQRRQDSQTFEIEPDEKLEESAARIANVLDDELADWPYSLEAVLAYLAEHRPDVLQRPCVLMGFSIGALGLPAVAARMPERFDAAVIVAGGANLLEIAIRSKKANPGVEVCWTEHSPSAEDWKRLFESYLAQAKLDPYNAVAALRGLPVLVIDGLFDQVVPASTGNVLYARLGKPNRLTYPVGHRHLLRVIMRLEAGRVVDWVEDAIAKRSGAAALPEDN